MSNPKAFGRKFGAALALALLASFSASQHAQAAAFLMTTDGVDGTNNSRAVTLGQSVTTNTLSGIIGMSQASLNAYDVIWINPGDPDYSALQAGVMAGGKLDLFVLGGGTLVLNVAGNSGDKLDIGPGGVDYCNYVSCPPPAQSQTFTTPSHPYLTGLFPGGVPLSVSDFNNWNQTDHGHLTSLVGGSTVVLSDASGPSWVQYGWGAGVVIVDTLTYGWGSGGAAGTPLNNLILYAADVSAVPEPASLALLGLGLLGLGWSRRKKA